MSLLHVQDPDVVITHPNRDTAAAKGTRAFVIVVLLASAALLAVILVGSQGARAGAFLLQVLIGLLFVYFAYAVSHWRSGVLPIAAGVAITSGIFAAVSVPSWFDRGGDGYKTPPIPESVLGVLVLAFAILQIVNVVVCLRGFAQNWQVELEVPKSEFRGDPATA
ncbi:MAG: hypothetical protein AAGC46_14735 [Solirubrobacteraceae bacterium]